MRHFKRVLVILVLVLIVAAAAIAIWQWDNLWALYRASTTSSETLSQQLRETKEKNQQTLAEMNINVQAPTLEQTDALLDGTVTPDEVKDSLDLKPTIDAASQYVDTDTDASSQSTSSQDTISLEEQATVLINACTAELYEKQVDLMADMGALYSATVQRWEALGDGRNATTKQQFISEGLQQCYSIESSTDSSVQSILSKYRTKLNDLGADDSALDQLWNMYVDEKNSQKAYYLSLYMN